MFLTHHATRFWSNLCCTKSSHIESRTAPLPGQKPLANSHPGVVFHISLLHQLSKLKATNLLFTHLCFLNASGLGFSHCFSLFSLELPSSLGHFPSLETWNPCKFSLYLSCPLNAMSKDWYIDDVELPLKVFLRFVKLSCRFLIPVCQFLISCCGPYLRFKTTEPPWRRWRSLTY